MCAMFQEDKQLKVSTWKITEANINIVTFSSVKTISNFRVWKWYLKITEMHFLIENNKWDKFHKNIFLTGNS